MLIELEVYILGRSSSTNDFTKWEFGSLESLYPQFLGDDFKLNTENYSLNKKFLDEVFDKWKEGFLTKSLPKIEDGLETLELQIKNSPESVISEMMYRETKSFNAQLEEKCLKRLYRADIDDTDLHFEILKNYLSYNWYELSSYLCGNENLADGVIEQQYWRYLYGARRIQLLRDFSIDRTKTNSLSLPKSIALLNEIGFFDMKYYNKLNSEEKSKLIAVILNLDYHNKDTLRSIKGNVSILINKDSKENPQKYTSYLHTEFAKDYLKTILSSISQ